MPFRPDSGVIVIVEDPFVQRYVKNVLGRGGHDAVESDAQRALSLVRNSDVKVKLLITNTPALFRPLANEVPVLYLASCPDPDLTSGFREVRVLQKPFRPEDLLRAVGEIAGSL